MKSFVKKIKGVRGYIPNTYAVYTEDYSCVLSIFLGKKEAEEFSRKYNDTNQGGKRDD